jgi:hypothetical protein
MGEPQDGNSGRKRPRLTTEVPNTSVAHNNAKLLRTLLKKGGKLLEKQSSSSTVQTATATQASKASPEMAEAVDR